ncbi:transposase DNA-binding-containing protein, partial [Deinococcus antarcticus]
MTTFHPLQAEQWALKHFGAVDLGDRRRNQRAVRIAQGMASRSGKSIPKLFDRRADVKAAYTFMS